MSDLQQQLFHDFNSRELFDLTHEYAMEYVSQVASRHVFPTDQAIEDLDAFEENFPQQIGSAKDIINLLHTKGGPATVAQLGGRYHGFVNGSSLPVGLAAKTLGTYWDQNTAMQVISPVSAKLESVVEGWLKEIFGLPEGTVAGFVSGTSTANLCGLAAARYRILKNLGWDANEKGLIGAPKVRIIAGRHAHSTVIKAISLLGFGKDCIEWVEVDEQGQVIEDKLPEIDERCIIFLQAGNVNSGGFDPFVKICRIARKRKAWVHVDGAFGLWAAGSPALSYLTEGVEMANSWATDGHKTLNTPYDCGIVMCDDKEAIVSALHMQAGYIILGEERDGMFFTTEMSRRSRIIELWATLKYLGKQGITQLVDGLHQRAVQFGQEMQHVKGIEVLNDVVFNQVLIAAEDDEKTENLLRKVQSERVCWVGGSTWFGRRVIRVSISAWTTTVQDITMTANSFKRAMD